MKEAMTRWEKTRAKARVLNALVIRELMVRYGHGNIGFFWLVAEPLLLTTGVIMLWSVIYGSAKHGINIVPFALTGYSMLTLWRHTVFRAIKCFSDSYELLYHRWITPIDILVVRHFSETFGVLIAFFVVYIPLLLMDLTEPIDDYLVFLGAWFLFSFFTFGVALIVASLSELSETVERFVNPIMYLLLPASGAFFMLAWLPRDVRDILELVPMVNATEMFRGGYLGGLVPTYWDAGYLFFCGLVANVAGLAMVGKAVTRLEVR